MNKVKYSVFVVKFFFLILVLSCIVRYGIASPMEEKYPITFQELLDKGNDYLADLAGEK